MLVGLIRNIEPLWLLTELTKYLVKHKVGQQLNSTPQNFSLSAQFIRVNSKFHKLSLHCTVNEKIKINFEFKSNHW